MDYVKLGATGLDVSRLCLGCMTFGEPDRGNHTWTLGKEASRPILRKAVEAGITFFDTANVYSDGSSEEIVGELLREMIPRDQLVLADVVFDCLPKSARFHARKVPAHAATGIKPGRIISSGHKKAFAIKILDPPVHQNLLC